VSAGSLVAHAVILAGGRGTRFWPRSRTRTPKQLLNIIGKDTMLEQTAARITPVFPPSHQWIVTNCKQVAAVRQQLRRVPESHVLAEPVGRNTAAAIGLAAAHMLHAGLGTENDAIMAVLPADHYIAKPAAYLRVVRAALHVAHAAGSLVVLGIPPTRPDTGFGYIEKEHGKALDADGAPLLSVRRFTEKPNEKLARKYVASGRYSIPRSKIFRLTTRSWSGSLGGRLHRVFLSCRRTLAGATSDHGRRSMNCSLARTGKMFPQENLLRSMPQEIFSGARRSLWGQSEFAIWSS